jgi:hypothetical protein
VEVGEVLRAGRVRGRLQVAACLLVSMNVFGRHSNKAFSSLAIEDGETF